jgi:phosphate transport system ATP-binding protein
VNLMTAIIKIKNLTVQYSDGTESLKNINLEIPEKQITAIFGPAGGGKSTLLRTLNRLNDLADVSTLSGEVLFHDQDILDPDTDVIELCRNIGMVFSRPVVLPLTIYKNVSYGLEVSGVRNKSKLDREVERALRQAVLWDEVYDRLHSPANELSGGQKQRLCLARSLALEPEVIMLDEPTSALDPVATMRIESLLRELSEEITILIAPHNTQQAARLADLAAFFLQGELIEVRPGEEMFTTPQDKRTEDYIQGNMG